MGPREPWGCSAGRGLGFTTSLTRESRPDTFRGEILKGRAACPTFDQQDPDGCEKPSDRDDFSLVALPPSLVFLWFSGMHFLPMIS